MHKLQAKVYLIFYQPLVLEDSSLEFKRFFSSKFTDTSSFSTSAELREVPEVFLSESVVEQGGSEMVVATFPFLIITLGMIFEAATGGVAHVKMAGINSSRQRGKSTP